MARRLLAAAFALLLPAHAAAAGPPIRHDARITFDLAAHRVTVVDAVTVPAGIDSLDLGAGLAVGVGEGVAPLGTPADEGFLRYALADLDPDGDGAFTLTLEGTFHQPTDAVSFSRENVGGEITATIGEEGIYLSSAAGWLPGRDGHLAVHRLEVVAPPGFVSVTQGRREQAADAPHVTTWIAEHPSDGINLIANRFFVNRETVREGLAIYTFLLEDDARLRGTYLERTRAYLDMYEEMIGPYPYAKFATVENWFPTGYGMPSYTLLGGQVLRLPFIPYTSFGHEIAHNWWGNSVFVDMAGGNWCEGLTSWCADYHYKELESPAAAREYRRNLLKDYQAYVREPANDFPLREFVSRHSGATRAVGYGKSMMVFHMLDRELGREAFLAGLRRVYAEHRFRQASWDDFLAAFGVEGGAGPDGFAAQWLDRAGAPWLQVSNVTFASDEVAFTLQQAAPAYTLRVPVTVTTESGSETHVVDLTQTTERFALPVGGAVRLAVDPDYDIFRRLHPQEVEPTLSQVLADEMPNVVVAGDDEAVTAAARAFGEAWTEGDYFGFFDQGLPPGDLPPGENRANLIINPSAQLAAYYRSDEVAVAGSTVVLAGKRYSLDQHDLVYAARNPFDGAVTDLVIHTRGPARLEGLARRLGHYGKYSWLLLPTGAGRVLRGNWVPADSPLVVEK